MSILPTLRRLAYMSAGAAAGAAAVYRADPAQLAFDAASAAGPALRSLLDAEAAHNLAVWAAEAGLLPRESRPDAPSLATTVWGRPFANPLGLAAGFDKDARGAAALLRLGFGFVEVGSVTPLPQPGNPRPRVFRLPEHRAVINRYGFNSAGADAARARLAALRAAGPLPGVLGVNLGKNKASPDAGADYAAGAAALAEFADYLVINVSSPNTPGLRALQGPAELEALLRRTRRARDAVGAGLPGGWAGRGGPPPLLVKVAPDLTAADRADVARAALRGGADGLIVSNTTVERPGPVRDHAHGGEAGGLSGAPLLGPATECLRDFYRLTRGRLPIVGAGGVGSGADAYAKIRAGASLVQVYTAFAYEGPALVPRIKRELAALLARDGYASVADAVGADHRAGR